MPPWRHTFQDPCNRKREPRVLHDIKCAFYLETRTSPPLTFCWPKQVIWSPRGWVPRKRQNKNPDLSHIFLKKDILLQLAPFPLTYLCILYHGTKNIAVFPISFGIQFCEQTTDLLTSPLLYHYSMQKIIPIFLCCNMLF